MRYAVGMLLVLAQPLFCLLDPCQTTTVEACPVTFVPCSSVGNGQFPVHCVAKRHFKGLEWPIESCADCRVPCVEPDGLDTITVGGGQICPEPIHRERIFQFIKESVVIQIKVLDIWGRTSQMYLVSSGPASASGMRPGHSISRH